MRSTEGTKIPRLIEAALDIVLLVVLIVAAVTASGWIIVGWAFGRRRLLWRKGEMSKLQLIRITGVPPGEAPLWVREQWVGLELPLAADANRPRRFVTSGVLTGPRNFGQLLLWHLLGRLRLASGYAVDVGAALAVLESKSPEAATWWRQNVPRILTKQRKFVFHAQICQPVSDA